MELVPQDNIKLPLIDLDELEIKNKAPEYESIEDKIEIEFKEAEKWIDIKMTVYDFIMCLWCSDKNAEHILTLDKPKTN